MNFIDDFCLSGIENPLVVSKPKGIKRKMGPPEIEFEKASPHAKKMKLDDPYKLTKKTCWDKNIPFEIGLGNMGARYFHNTNPQLEALFKCIASGKNPMEPKNFGNEMSKYVKRRLLIGQEDWDWFRGLLLPSVVFTSRSKLQAYTISENAPKESFNHGFWIRLDYALPITLKEILELKEDYNPSNDHPNSLELTALVVRMYDGSGSHVQMQGRDIDVSTRNMIIGGDRIPLITDKIGNVIHLEDNQSEATFRPTFLCPGKETQTGELVRSIIERMDKEAEELPSIKIELNGITIVINLNYHPGAHSQIIQWS